MTPPEGVAIVTGGTSYLGAAAARSLALTHAVAITDLKSQEDEGRKLVTELGEDRAMFLTCDVRWTLLLRMLLSAVCTGVHAQVAVTCSSPLRVQVGGVHRLGIQGSHRPLQAAAHNSCQQCRGHPFGRSHQEAGCDGHAGIR